MASNTDDRVKETLGRIQREELKGDLAQHIQHVAELAPEMFQSYTEWREAVLKDGALARKIKLLITVGIMTVLRADDALTLYSRIARNAGSSREELLEAMAVGALFSGGPGLVAMANAIRNIEREVKL
ncbi:MAG: carboxymuconolactone decarboxylase family protein [Methanomicrobiales archaeon]|nr:carboxymuconolactone decarboxylase family protein [Methanomicrobiales archaeon]